MNELRKRLGDKRFLAAAALVIVGFVYLRSRRSSSVVTDASTLPVDPTTGLLPADGSFSPVGGGLTLDDLSPLQAALEGIGTGLGDLQTQIATSATDTQSAFESAFQQAQAANFNASTPAAAAETGATPTSTSTPTPTPAPTPAPPKTAAPGAPAGVPLAFTIAGGLDPAIAAAYAARNKPPLMTSTVPVATLPPAPTPVNESPAPAPPSYPTPAVAGTPPPSMIAVHLARGRDVDV